MIAHTTSFVTPVVEHWLEREISQWVHPMKDRSDDRSHHERTLLRRSYISLRKRNRNMPTKNPDKNKTKKNPTKTHQKTTTTPTIQYSKVFN